MLLDKATRTSTIAYKNQGSQLLKVLHMKCAPVDENTKLRARMQFLSCRMTFEETAINFLTRLEQKANEARNYDIRISERKFLWVLLNNMKHHKYYKERIASFLTTFELNPSSISQRWIENKFYSLDEERMHLFRSTNRFQKESARFSHSQKSSKTHSNSPRQFSSPTSNKMIRCKYCYRSGHIDTNCRQKAMKRPPSMPEWVSKAECKKCKKKGHLSFNCPPRYDNKPLKHRNEQRYNKYNNKETANVCEFAGMTSHHTPYCLKCKDYQNRKLKKNT